MSELSHLQLTPEYRDFLEEWAKILNVSVDVLLGRIVKATVEGFLYTEEIPDYLPLN